MPRTPRTFTTDQYYHVLNRGVAKQPIFADIHDRDHFLQTLAYYQQHRPDQRLSFADFQLKERKPPYRFHIVAYHLMPNHFHLILQHTEDGGISQGLADIQNS
ncbi:hypothetical protein HYZ64_03820, partial [Candidatus Berkelbacteria bacterium]|nr:hypothetical protein [Candidatus Berkelbacteria bacterium]